MITDIKIEEGSVRVSLYEIQLLIGQNPIFHRLLMQGRESLKSIRYISDQYRALLTSKRAILGNRCNKTGRRAAERAPTGKPKVSKVTSGYGGVVILLSRDRPSQRKGGFIGVA